MLGSRMGVDISQSVDQINTCLLEDGKGKCFICWWKETWVFTKGMEGSSIESSTLQGRGSNRRRKNIMLLRRVEEDWNRVVLKTWLSKTISRILEDKVGGKQLQLGNFAPIKDKFSVREIIL